MNGPLVADIVQFLPKVPDNVVWRCNCGCISFELRADGNAVCAQCLKPVTGMDGSWREKLPELLKPVEPADAKDVTITDLNSSAAALRRVLGRADPERTAMLIIIQQDGAVTSWGESIEGEARAEWFDRRVQTAKQMLTKVEGPAK